MSKKWLKTVCAALTSAALTMSLGAAVYAEDAIAIPGLDQLAGSSESVMTASVKVSGEIDPGTGTPMAIDADIECVTDVANGQQSASGSVNASGITVDFAEYLDCDRLLLEIPGLGTTLSYRYTADPEGTILAQMMGSPEILKAINNVIALMHGTMHQDEKFMQYVQELSAAMESSLGSISPTPVEKECLVGGESVTCEGTQVVITKDTAAAFFDALFGVHLPNGQTFEEYFDMIQNLQAMTGGETTDVMGTITSTLDDMPDVTAAVYNYEGMPVEATLSAEGSTLALVCAGETIPYTDIRLTADGEVVGQVVTDLTESSANIRIMAGEDMTVATIALDLGTGSFTLSSPYLPSEITGTVSADGNGVTFQYEDLTVSVSITAGGTVVVPEGDVLELTEMTAEEFQSIASVVGSMFGGMSMDAAA